MTKLETLALVILSITVMYGVFYAKEVYFDAPTATPEGDN